MLHDIIPERASGMDAGRHASIADTQHTVVAPAASSVVRPTFVLDEDTTLTYIFTLAPLADGTPVQAFICRMTGRDIGCDHRVAQLAN